MFQPSGQPIEIPLRRAGFRLRLSGKKKGLGCCHPSPCFSGEPDRIRTCDPLIKSQLLYQLSYRPTGALPRNFPPEGQAGFDEKTRSLAKSLPRA